MQSRALLTVIILAAVAGSRPQPAGAQPARASRPPAAKKAIARKAAAASKKARPQRQRQQLHSRLGRGLTQFVQGGRFAAPFETGLPTALLTARTNPGAWGRQRMSQWCWAATSQMILNYHGLPVSQEAVITRAYGGYLDRPASVHEIARTLSGWVVPRGAGRAVVGAQAYNGLTTSAVLADLQAGKPLIVGLTQANGQGGHAYVLTSVKWGRDAAGNPIAVSAKLRDPWPTNPSSIELSWAEVSQRFAGAVRIDTAAIP